MEVDPKRTRRSVEHEGARYFFCSDSCRDRFVGDPGPWVKAKKVSLSFSGVAVDGEAVTGGSCCHGG